MRTAESAEQRRRLWRRMFLAVLLGAVPVSAPLVGGTAAAAASPPHIMVIVEENQGYTNIIGNSKAPYINGLVSHVRVCDEVVRAD